MIANIVTKLLYHQIDLLEDIQRDIGFFYSSSFGRIAVANATVELEVLSSVRGSCKLD